MSKAQNLLLADEDLRLQECAQEPIQVPGAIQPHGVLLAVDTDTLEILQASENTADIIGIDASSLLETCVADLVDAQTDVFLRAALAADSASPTKSCAAVVEGRAFDIATHRVDDVGIVEFEPAIPLTNGRSYLSAVHEASQRLARASDADELRRIAAHELRQLTGFDQVMAYQFHPDGHGEVVADDHVAGMSSYLGLHFPASDIPVQARRLYQLKGSGLIATSDYQPAALFPINNPRTGTPLDLSRAELRSVSPHHLQFMRNMGQGASFTLSLLLDGQIVGLVTCAHRTPRRIPFAERRMCEVLVQLVILQLHAMMRAEGLALQLHSRDVRALLRAQMELARDVATGLTDDTTTILDLMSADGAAVYLDHRHSHVGDTPSCAQVTGLITALTQADGSVSPLLSDSLAHDWPALAALVPSFAGVFVLPVGRAGDYLVWFRRELAQTVDWLGDQSPDNRSTPLSPRTSFERWRQTVTDRSAPWDEMDVDEASELVRDIDQILLHRAEVALAHMASHDSLTGLPNRHLLIDRITVALERDDRRSGQVAILFCDLDDFKRINDTGGHAAGDAVLVEAATRLQSVLRVGDSVARVGGDEFVVVLESDRAPEPTEAPSDVPHAGGPAHRNIIETETEAENERGDVRRATLRIAERIRSELGRPISYRGRVYITSVSVGITFAERGSRAEDLVREADTAMYRAKQTGKSCVAIFDDSMRTGMLEHTFIERVLHTVLSPGGLHDQHSDPKLVVVYRPFVHLDSGRFIGFEARPQLTDFDGRPIPLEKFKPVAEDTGMIDVLEATVLDAGLAALADWQKSHPADASARIALTLGSARLARHVNMTTLVQSALDRHGLDPSDLIIELTESALIEAGSSAIGEVAELRNSGIGIALNNFGMGYASLQHLAVLPISAIKVDPSFTAALPNDATSAMIVRAIAGLAADMNLVCVVSGIDNEQQLRALPRDVIALGSLIGDQTTAPTYDATCRSSL